MTIFVTVDRWIQSWFHWENSHVKQKNVIVIIINIIIFWESRDC